MQTSSVFYLITTLASFYSVMAQSGSLPVPNPTPTPPIFNHPLDCPLADKSRCDPACPYINIACPAPGLVRSEATFEQMDICTLLSNQTFVWACSFVGGGVAFLCPNARSAFGVQTALICFPPNLPLDDAGYCFCSNPEYPRFRVSEVPDIRFIGHARNVTEAEGTTTICVISGQLADEIIPVNVTISTVSYTARGGLDFVNFSQMVSFLASNESYCVNISILEDDIGEVSEYFLLKVELDYTFSVFLDSFNITIAVDCGTLTNPVNGQVSHTAVTTFGQTATYSCNTGYNLVGNNTRTCQATGVWSGSAPSCQAVDCGTLISPVNGQVSHTAVTTFGQTATYSCNTGYTLVGNSIRTCQATGVWSGSVSSCQVVDCGTLTNPVNGQVSQTAGTTFGQTSTYSCNTGYNLMGNNTRTCQATGVWSGSAPSCQAMDCGILISPVNGQVSHTAGTTFGQTATYSCNTGYTLVGNSIRTCQATGVWSGSASSCQVVDCGTLTNPVNGQVSHTAGTTFGQTATYSCNTGYNLVGNNTRTCEATGVWSGSAPSCQAMDCGILISPVNGQVSHTAGTTFGETATYSCDTGYTLVGNSIRTCQATGVWSGSVSSCQVVDCGTLTNPVNGQVSHTAGTTFGQTATYSCNTGYTLVGNSIRTCQATGVWSGSAPSCQVFCEAEVTGFLSWSDTPAGTTRTLHCPSTSIMISRTCSLSGVWESVDSSLCTSFTSINTDNITLDNFEEVLQHLSGAVKGVAISEQLQTRSNLVVVAATFSRSVALISEGTIISNETVQNLISILEGLLQWNEDVLQANASNIVRSFDVIVGVFAQQLVEGGSYSFMTENVLFVAELLSQAELVATGRSFSSGGQTGNTNINTLNVCETAAVFLPASLFQFITSNNVGIFYAVYDTGALFPIKNATEILREAIASVTTVVGSPVLAVTVGAGLNFNGLVDPVRILLRLKVLENVTSGPPRCVSWDFGLEEWTTEGCQTTEVNESVVICNCNHLTNFAVLVDVCSRFAMLDIDGCSEDARYCHHDATCNNSQALSPGTIAGIIVGTIAGLVLIAVFFFIVFLLRKLLSGRFLKHESPAVPLSVAQIRLHGNIEYKATTYFNSVVSKDV